MAKLANTQIVVDMQRPGEDTMSYITRSHQEIDKLLAVSNALSDDQIVGGIVRFPVADGYAMYQVTSEKPLTLQHIAYGDCWNITAAHMRGLRKADIQEMLQREKAIRQIFAQKTV